MRVDPAKYCHAKTRYGLPCRGFHMTDSIYCFWHHPVYREKRLRAAQQGGEAPPGIDALWRHVLRHARK